MSFWDQAYQAEGYKYGTQPNDFLRAQAHRLPPGARVLLPGDGEGRNSVWLAQQGHRCTALDGSAVGLDKARALASQRGVSLDLVQADVCQWEPEPASYDAVVWIYLHLSPEAHQQALKRTLTALRPGGLWMLEAFHPRQLAHCSGGPKDPAMLYTPEQLAADTAGALHTELLWDGEVMLDEGPGHQGRAHVTRLLGWRL